MYITDKIQTDNISMQDAENMYYTLRDKGYVWVDVKPDNIGRQAGALRILNDVDIYTVQDVYNLGKTSVLDFVSYNKNLALLELNWLRSKDNNFDINQIDKYFNNQSSSTIEKICEIKDEYLRRQAKYKYNPYENDLKLYERILMQKIDDYNLQQTSSRSR